MINRTIKMSKVITGFNVALLELDMDVDAERVFAMDRNTGITLVFGLRPPSGIWKIILDKSYAVDSKLLVGIIDTDNQFNATVIDGVKLKLVDGNFVDLSQ
jgi:uncharacterized UPF0146 family protein